MKTAFFTSGGITIKATAMSSAGMGFLSRLVTFGVSEDYAFERCIYFEYIFVTIEYMVNANTVKNIKAQLQEKEDTITRIMNIITDPSLPPSIAKAKAIDIYVGHMMTVKES